MAPFWKCNGARSSIIEKEHHDISSGKKMNEEKCGKSQPVLPNNIKNGILLPKLFWPTVRKKCSSGQEKLLKFNAKGREFAKNFQSTRTIFSNSERPEQFLVTECFFNLFLEVSHI